MEQFVSLRDNIIIYYKKYENIINVILKLICGIFVFSRMATMASSQVSSGKLWVLSLIFSIIGALCSSATGYMFVVIIALILMSLLASIEVALIMVCVVFVVYAFYIRLFPKESVLIIGTMAALYFHIPYIIPVIAMLYFSISSVGAIGIGTFMFYFASLPEQLVKIAPRNEFAPLEAFNKFIDMYVDAATVFNSQSQWMFMAATLIIGTVVGYALMKTSLDYVREIACGAAFGSMLLSVIICDLFAKAGINILTAIISIAVCAVISVAVVMFGNIFDYDSKETVEFEDEKNYYYVKVVPKYIMNTKRAKHSSKIRKPQNQAE